MKKFLKWLVIGLGVAFLAIQVYRPARTNPHTDPARTLQATTPVPPHIDKILQRACNDCHSNDTRWPWYSNLAPASWFLVDHVNEGRHELSFSEIGAYSAKKRAHKFEELCEMVKNGSMPIDNYVWLHPDAKLSQADVQALCAWSAPFATKR